LQAKDPKIDGRQFLENWIATRYHAPSDDMNQPRNFDATVQFHADQFSGGLRSGSAAGKSEASCAGDVRQAQIAKPGIVRNV
jgi:hypothetical protein